MSARDGFPVQIGGRRYAIDVEQVTWRTVPATRPGADQGAGAGEQSLSNEAVWRRSRDNWVLGAGQEYADLIEESDERRFRSSHGADPWTTRTLTVLNTVDEVLPSAETNLMLAVAEAGGVEYLIHSAGTTLAYSADASTWTSFTGGGSDPWVSLTTDGNRLWASDGSTVYVGVPGTAALSTFSTYDADTVAYANGRLLAAKGNELVELDSTGTPVPIFTHTNAAFVWDGIAPSPGGIYVFGHAGDRSEVFVVTAIDATGALDVPFVAAQMPDGEIVNAMCSYAGVMLLGTSRGLRLALITGGGFLSYGPVIDEVGPVRALEPQGEDVWFGWKRSAAVNGLGRARLSRFTEELVPAYASDLVLPTTSDSQLVSSIVTHGGRRVFATPGIGIHRQHSAYMAVGEVDLGWFTYGIAEPKVLDSVTVWTDALPADCKVEVSVFADDATTPLTTLVHDDAGATKATVAYSGAAEAERLRVTVAIYQDHAAAELVKVRRVTLRSVPKPHVAQQITLPLIISDAVRHERTQVGQNPFEEFTYLEGLVHSRERVALRVGDWAATVRLDAIEVERGGLGGGNGLEGWADDGAFMAGVWHVTMTTVEEP